MRFLCYTHRKHLESEIFMANTDPGRFMDEKGSEVIINAIKKYANGQNLRPVHLLLSLLESDDLAVQEVVATLPNVDALRGELTALADSTQTRLVDKPTFASETVEAIRHTLKDAIKLRVKRPAAVHLFLGILKQGDSLLVKTASNHGLTYARVFAMLATEPETETSQEGEPITIISAHVPAPKRERAPQAQRPARRPNANSALEKMSVNMTTLAANGEYDKVIGRDNELDRVVHILSRRTKNNPILLGEPGVGKTAVVEGLAQRIVQGDVPKDLEGKQVYSLDLGNLVAGTRFRGDFEERMKVILEEASTRDDVILFIDEIHTLRGAGNGEGGLDAANFLKPYLARGKVQMVGATTQSEYRKHFEKDAALARRFQPIRVEEPSAEMAVEILKALAPVYAKHHGVTIPDETVAEAVALSVRYVHDRYLPDKAIDLLDEAAAKVKLVDVATNPEVASVYVKLEELERKKETATGSTIATIRKREDALYAELDVALKNAKIVTKGDIAEVISRTANIPVGRVDSSESRRLLVMERELKKRIVGQEKALKTLSQAIRRQRTGLNSPNRPAGSFIFAGPTGVGKTEVAKTLAEYLFGSEDALITLDMSEYSDRHTAQRLFGAPPGYVGYDEGGQLTEKVKAKPFSVILLDEIEKAHPAVFDPLLQVLEEGRLTDGQGREVIFRNTVIIMTTNLGVSDTRNNPVGFQTGDETDAYRIMQEKVNKALQTHLRPEFLNRIDEKLVFPHLSIEQVDEIANRMIGSLNARVAENENNIIVTEEARALMLEKGYNKIDGARPMRRVIENEIGTLISETILFDETGVGLSLIIDAANGEFTVNGSSRDELENKMDELELEEAFS